MKFTDLSGKVRTGKLTKDHPQSSDGRSILVVQGEAHGSVDVTGWPIAKATDWKREILERMGYRLEEEE